VGDDDVAVAADRFQDVDGRHPGHWRSKPSDWGRLPDAVLASAETRRVIEDAIAVLPSAQRHVITLRDVEGFDSSDVCSVLELTENNQRVLLHRARSKVRAALELHLDGVAAS
jgi:RNA polymerase sigma-70 factor (ECF subfamily)